MRLLDISGYSQFDREVAVQIISEVNTVRQESGCEELAPERVLHSIITTHVRDMNKRDYCAHESPERIGYMQRLVTSLGHGQFLIAGESLCYKRFPQNMSSVEVARALMDEWMGSAKDRGEILNSFTHLGVGVQSNTIEDKRRVHAGIVLIWR